MKGRKPNFYTFVETLNWWAAHQPDQIAYTYLVDGEREEIHLTYVALDRRARAIGARLQSLGAAGERVILLFPSGLDYIAAFFGCLYARAIAIPVYPPHRRRPDPRLSAIVKDAQATIVLTTSSIQAEMQPQLGQMPELAGAYWIASDAIADEEAEQWKMPALTGETIAYLQYTSGSTAAPKGVMVSHGNLIYNNQMLKRAFEHVNPVLVSWLPIYHDMGLVGNILQPLYLGSRAIFMAPTAFLQSPYRWLQAISRYQANTSGGPNFSYELCVEKITPEQRETLDLSSWSIAYNAAEPVRHATLERFSSTFAPYGFRCEAFYPGYGLAEATLFVSGGCKNAPPITQSFEKAALARDQVIATSAANKTVLSLVDCGHTWLDQQIAIVDPKSTTRCPPGQVGEIWIAGPNVAQGYWNQPDATATTFQAYLADTGEGPFLRTGDLGFLHGEDLFVTGRIKDLIIIHGKNYYPQDIELTVEQSHPSLRPGCCAALSLDIGGEERLVIVAEIEREYLRGLESNEVFGAVRRAVAHEHQVAVYAIQLLKPAQILKTSSGKLQRHLYRERFLAHGFELVGSWQSATTAGEETPQAVGSALFNGSLHNPFDVPLATANGQPDHSLIPAFRAKRPVARADSTPQSLTEKRLVALWADVFKVDHVGRHDNFFDLGGHSLRATALIHQVQTEFSVSFSVDQLYEAPTVAGMAQVIEQLSTPATTAPASVTPMLWTLPGSLIPLQTAGTQPPLFCVHPLAGVVFPYYELAAALGNDQPVYGLQAVGLAANEQPLTRIEAMAAEYIKALRLVQPAGPYLLCGWSFGGHIAYEMAQQLHQAGEEIALLALIDEPPATGFRFSNAFRFIATVFLPTVWPYVFEYFQLLAGRGPKVGNRGESQNGEKGAVLTGRKESAGGAGSWLAEALRVMRVTQVNLQAGHSYSPQPYPGHVTLFRTTYAAYGENRHLPDLGWQALAQGGLEIHPMPGRHFNLLRKPHVQVLAGQLRSCIDTAVNQHQGLNLGHRVHQPPASQILQRGEATTNR